MNDRTQAIVPFSFRLHSSQNCSQSGNFRKISSSLARRRPLTTFDEMMRAFFLLALFALLAPGAALRAPLPTRRQALSKGRQAIIAGASLASFAPLAAQASKAGAKEADALDGIATVLAGASVAIVGVVGYNALGAKSKSDKAVVNNLEKNRFATDAELKKMGKK